MSLHAISRRRITVFPIGAIAAFIVGAVLTSISLAFAAEPEGEPVRAGEYGRLADYRHWNIVLSAEDVGVTIRVAVELKADAIYTQLIEMKLAGGKSIAFSAPPSETRAYRLSPDRIRFGVLVPVPAEFRQPHGNWQMVDVTLTATEQGAQAQATTPDSSLRCAQCAVWRGHSHRTREGR